MKVLGRESVAGSDAMPRLAVRTTSVSQRSLRRAALATGFATYALVVLGSTVRVTESGMGCPGWPLCYGQIGPVDRYHALLEQTHRYLAAAVTIGVVLVVFLAWRSGAGRRVIVPALAAVALVGVQVGLGAVTVVTHNAPATVAAHLIGALLLLAAVTLTAVASYAVVEGGQPSAQTNGRPRLLAWSALAAMFVLFISGSIVVDGGASKACPSWPLCRSDVGTAQGLVIIQLAHRAMVVIASVLVIIYAVQTLARQAQAPGGRTFAWVIIGLLPAQVAVGATSAVLRAPTAAQDIHLGLASAIWCFAVALVATESFSANAFSADRAVGKVLANTAIRSEPR